MTAIDVTLSASQLRVVELALAGAWGRSAALSFTGTDVAEGDVLVLRDAEGTDVASLTARVVEVTPGGPAPLQQLGTGAAPPLPTRIEVTGDVTPGRPLGHRDRLDLRATESPTRRRYAVLITGVVPVDGWDEHPGPVIVLDRGDSRALAAAVTAVESAGRDPIVLPAATSLAETVAAARDLVADDIDVWRTPLPPSPGRVILLTGLSGSGKSTIAKLLVQRLAETDPRTVTLLDGDEVRLILSAGLGFSRADRMLNVQRIGWVGSLIAKHGGIAVCAPIAPYATMRCEMRQRVEEVGKFLLVHVATPLEVCETRDRKGLYAKARAGEVPQFTGISDPYQIPDDADVVVDTSEVPPDIAVDRITAALQVLDAEQRDDETGSMRSLTEERYTQDVPR